MHAAMRIYKALSNKHTIPCLHKGYCCNNATKTITKPTVHHGNLLVTGSSCWNGNMRSCKMSIAGAAGLGVIANICRHGMCYSYTKLYLTALVFCTAGQQGAHLAPCCLIFFLVLSTHVYVDVETTSTTPTVAPATTAHEEHVAQPTGSLLPICCKCPSLHCDQVLRWYTAAQPAAE
jgi:hypothetical protein